MRRCWRWFGVRCRSQRRQSASRSGIVCAPAALPALPVPAAPQRHYHQREQLQHPTAAASTRVLRYYSKARPSSAFAFHPAAVSTHGDILFRRKDYIREYKWDASDFSDGKFHREVARV